MRILPMKTYTIIPNNISKLNLADIYRFTCLSFQPHKNGYTDTTFKQLMLLTKDKSEETLKDFIKRLREAELIKIETVKEHCTNKSSVVNRNHYYFPLYTENFRMIHKDIIDCDLTMEDKGFLIGLFVNCINNSKDCKFTIVKIAKVLDLNRKTAAKYLKKLIELGYILKVKGGYELKVDWLLVSDKRERLIQKYKDMGLDTVYKIDWERVLNPEKYANALLSGLAHKKEVKKEQLNIIL